MIMKIVKGEGKYHPLNAIKDLPDYMATHVIVTTART
jgi:hypothetical protein